MATARLPRCCSGAARTAPEHFTAPLPVLRILHASGNEDSAMARCDVCGNDYDKSFSVNTATGSGTFDCFECAIHALAPT